jgi:hypothetical protein
MRAELACLLSGVMMWFFQEDAHADWPQPPDEIQRLVVSMNDADGAGEGVIKDMVRALADVRPGKGNKVDEGATKDRGYVLSGDLFGTGGFFALYEPKRESGEDFPTLALAEHVEGSWKTRGLWKMQLYWIPKDERWVGPDNQYGKGDLPSVPFLLRDLIADGTPEVIVSGEMSKYHQARYVMKYDKQSHKLDLLTFSWDMPARVGDYLRIYDASGNKAVWEEWRFYGWKDDKLVERAMWHSESPYNNVDPAFYLASTTGPDGKLESFRFTMPEGPLALDISRNDEPFGKVTCGWLPGKSEENDDLMTGAWIFEKVTGLPREYFPEGRRRLEGEGVKLRRLEESATVEVTGSDEVKQRFPVK